MAIGLLYIRANILLAAAGFLFVSLRIDSIDARWPGRDPSKQQELDCEPTPRQDLSNECDILKVFNQVLVDQMTFKETIGLARFCACELNDMPWEEAYDDTPNTRKLESMVSGVIHHKRYENKYPVYLWSDADVLMKGVSIYTATNDYFTKRRQNASWSAFTPKEIDNDVALNLTRLVCTKISRDRLKLYQYLENLGRLSPKVFYELVMSNRFIFWTYQASKACKLLILHRLHDFKLTPDNRQLITVDRLTPKQEFDQLSLSTNFHLNDNLDSALKQASVYLINCKPWQGSKLSLSELGKECPMMFSEDIPEVWTSEHSTSIERSRAAANCGCQLLLHNNTWKIMMDEPNVMKLSQALTNYINANKFPHLNESPIWTIYGWFNSVMDKFIEDKHLAIREIMKLLRNEDDLTVPMNRRAKDEMFALEVIRRGCLYLKFNKSVGATNDRVGELKLIKYLDNLLYISRDPMFVFHLTLQDANLFKLHALGKICIPFLNK